MRRDALILTRSDGGEMRHRRGANGGRGCDRQRARSRRKDIFFLDEWAGKVVGEHFHYYFT
jgi:hypothetical protein